MAQRNSLSIIKAQENNLKDLVVDLPHDSFIAITGLSGSGKSSLAFDTIYAEGSADTSRRSRPTRASSSTR